MQRTLHAIEVKVIDKHYLGVIVWPGEQKKEGCCVLPDRSQSWLDVKAGDTVLMKNNKNIWTQRTVESIRLFRVFPVDFNGTFVETARAWVEG